MTYILLKKAEKPSKYFFSFLFIFENRLLALVTNSRSKKKKVAFELQKVGFIAGRTLDM